MRCGCAVSTSGGYVNLSLWGVKMMQVIEAIYSGGVLKPVEKLALPETQRVRLIVQPLNEKGDNSRSAALQRLLVGIESMQFFSSGPFPTREELHDRF